MPPDSTDTKRRIRLASRDEFAKFGLAGARIDRIAESAGVNKRSIYVHFGPKEELFDFVIAQALTELAEQVPFTVDDLPAYAGALFDYLIATPTTLRLTAWAGLERPKASPAESLAYRPKMQALAEQFGAAGVDVLALLLGLVTSWFSASPALRAYSTKEPWSKSRLQTHRALMVAAAAALVDFAKATSTSATATNRVSATSPISGLKSSGRSRK